MGTQEGDCECVESRGVEQVGSRPGALEGTSALAPTHAEESPGSTWTEGFRVQVWHGGAQVDALAAQRSVGSIVTSVLWGGKDKAPEGGTGRLWAPGRSPDVSNLPWACPSPGLPPAGSGGRGLRGQRRAWKFQGRPGLRTEPRGSRRFSEQRLEVWFPHAVGTKVDVMETSLHGLPH